MAVYVSNKVAFGDLEDVFIDEIVKSNGGTINYEMNTRRNFLPGKYYLMEMEGAVIICHENVDPEKIYRQLKDSNVGKDFRLSNYLNRYDWMHYRNWGEEEEYSGKDEDSSEEDEEESIEEDGEESIKEDKPYSKEKTKDILKKKTSHLGGRKVCYFIPEENLVKILDDGKEIGTDIGFSFDTDKIISEDWVYGCLLQDSDTKLYFALVVQDVFTYEWKSGEQSIEESDSDLASVNYVCDINKFI